MKNVILLMVITVISVWAAMAYADAGDLRGAHKDAGFACADCHGTNAPDKKAPASVCRTCHADHKGEVKTYYNNGAEVEVNPHKSHNGELRCTLCHRIHEPSVLYCNQEGCHAFDANMNVK